MTIIKTRLSYLLGLTFGGYPMALIASYYRVSPFFVIVIVISGITAAYTIKNYFKGWATIYAFIAYSVVSCLLNYIYAMSCRDTPNSLSGFLMGTFILQVGTCLAYIVILYLPRPRPFKKSK